MVVMVVDDKKSRQIINLFYFAFFPRREKKECPKQNVEQVVVVVDPEKLMKSPGVVGEHINNS